MLRVGHLQTKRLLGVAANSDTNLAKLAARLGCGEEPCDLLGNSSLLRDVCRLTKLCRSQIVVGGVSR